MLSNQSLEALRRLAIYREDQTVKWASAAELGVKTSTLAGLVRRHFARSVEQSELVRGERRQRWRLYQITDRGLHYVPIPDSARFGYKHMLFMEEMQQRLCAARGLDPNIFHSHVYLDASWAWGELQSRRPTYRQRQEAARERNENWVAPATPKLTNDEIAYLIERLAGVNDPVGMKACQTLQAMLSD